MIRLLFGCVHIERFDAAVRVHVDEKQEEAGEIFSLKTF